MTAHWPIKKMYASETQLVSNIARLERHLQANPHLCVYVHMTGHNKGQYKSMVAQGGLEIKLLRPCGPFPINLLAYIIAGHEALVKITQPDRLPGFCEAELMDDMIATIYVFNSQLESSLIATYRDTVMFSGKPPLFEHDHEAIALKFVVTDAEEANNVVCWTHIGHDSAFAFSLDC